MSVIKITSRVSKMLKEIYKTSNKKYIKFGIKSGGCSGFQYYLKPSDKEQSKIDEIIKENDYTIKICGQSLFKLLHTEIDWEDNIMGKRFVFNNPNADFNCGCGKSFG